MTLKSGDRVRVVMEGEVTVDRHGTSCFLVGGSQGNYIDPNDGHVVSVEVLPPPEPEWKPGNVVMTPAGGVYVRGENGSWYVAGSTMPFRDDRLQRPLTRLVPEGQA